MADEHEITQLSVWLDKPAVQQAFTTLACEIIQARCYAETYGKEAAARKFGGDKDGTATDYPVAGKVVIGRMGALKVEMTIESEDSCWSGEELQHDEIKAIGISSMVVGGKKLTMRDKQS
ncbi:hypothetical protein ACUN8C_05715 [Kushneria sp. Sum13]|uniref:hypothetical protein n=1 Tax=Kushneria sp. Sum13 TaxID=3459196 RepID=UPI004045C92D